MKKIALMAFLPLLFSCKKDTINPGQPKGEGSIEYTIKGDNVKIVNNNSVNLPISLVKGVRYYIPNFVRGYEFLGSYNVTSTTQNENNKMIMIVMGIDSVTVGKKYDIASGNMSVTLQHKNVYYSTDTDPMDSSYFFIKVTNYHDGLISGEFSGNLLTPDQNDNFVYTLVTNGKFTNVRMNY